MVDPVYRPAPHRSMIKPVPRGAGLFRLFIVPGGWTGTLLGSAPGTAGAPGCPRRDCGRAQLYIPHRTVDAHLRLATTR